MKVTPIEDFNCQSFPINPYKQYDITEEELIKLRNHELKWHYEEETIEVEDLDNPIFDEEGNITYPLIETIKYTVTLIPNDNSQEIARKNALNRIVELKQLLAESDYVVIKINEAIIDNDTDLVDELKETYADILIQRKEAREEINELEQQLYENSEN